MTTAIKLNITYKGMGCVEIMVQGRF